MTIGQPDLVAPLSDKTTSWWSVERLLYALAFFIGVALRFWSLGQQPLSPWEASNSWPAWLLANGLHVVDTPSPTSSLYFGLQWLLFWTGVNSDGGARFISVVAGSALILLPWWWRSFLGRRVALVFAFFIAIDSWLIGFSRLADGASLSITLFMFAMVSLTQIVENPLSTRWPRAWAVAFGLLLVSGPVGWNFLPVVLLMGWLQRAELAEAGFFRRGQLLWVGGAALAGATLFFARLDSISWIASGMSVWLSQIDGERAGAMLPVITSGYELWWPWQRLVVDSAPLIPLGVGGLVLLALRAQRNDEKSSSLRRLLALCTMWLVWALVLFLLPGRSPLALPVMGLPLILLSAYFIDALFTTVPVDVDWREIGAVVITLIILLVSGLFWLTGLLATQNFDSSMAQAALVIFGLALAILVAFTIWANRRDALWVAATLVAALLLVVYLRSSWKLNFGSALAEPSGWQATVTHPEVRLLAGDLETISSHRSGDPYQLPVLVQVASTVTGDDQLIPARPDPVVGWELRNMRNLAWVKSPMVSADTEPLPLVLTPATSNEEAESLALPNTYAGSRYHVDSWWLPETLEQEAHEAVESSDEDFGRRLAEEVQPWWRWFIYRDVTRAPQNRDVILWAPMASQD